MTVTNQDKANTMARWVGHVYIMASIAYYEYDQPFLDDETYDQLQQFIERNLKLLPIQMKIIIGLGDIKAEAFKVSGRITLKQLEIYITHMREYYDHNIDIGYRE